MATTPAFAAEMPSGLVIQPADASAVHMRFDTSTYDSDTDIAEWRRGWGRRGWRRGWRRHRRGVRAGDVLAGVLILGGIAAVASAANNNRRRERDVVIVERDRDRDRYEERRRDDRRDNPRRSGTSGLESAVSQCVDRIERDIRVDSVDSVDRTGEGWLVAGSLFNGSSFLCRIGNDGRIADVEYGGFASRNDFEESDYGENRFEGSTRAEGQLDDDAYRAARGRVASQPEPRRVERVAERTEGQGAERPSEPLVPLTAERTPEYPGGPLPGEEYPETLAQVDADLPN
ncbi:MAG: hypothetical protein QNJ15_07740 [Erythrobacter sp.]|nr:hypothetical protein [Erythrobacter sp.]